MAAFAAKLERAVERIAPVRFDIGRNRGGLGRVDANVVVVALPDVLAAAPPGGLAVVVLD